MSTGLPIATGAQQHVSTWCSSSVGRAPGGTQPGTSAIQARSPQMYPTSAQKRAPSRCSGKRLHHHAQWATLRLPIASRFHLSCQSRLEHTAFVTRLDVPAGVVRLESPSAIRGGAR